MVTKEQALTAMEFHENGCEACSKVYKWRRNGKTQTWKTRPNDFCLPIKYGLYSYGHMTHNNAHQFHLLADCPLNTTS